MSIFVGIADGLMEALDCGSLIRLAGGWGISDCLELAGG